MSDGTVANFIVYADDDADDQDLFRELILKIVPQVQLVVRQNGEDLLQFLAAFPEEPGVSMLIILDLNMPGWDGIETLTGIRKNKRFQDVPVIIFSTTSDEKDRNRALSAGATAFVTKPSNYRELHTIISSFITYLK